MQPLEKFILAETSSKGTPFNSTSVKESSDLALSQIRSRVFRTSPERPWSYLNLIEYQNQVLQKILDENAEGELIFSELDPVVTMGYRMKDDPRVGTVDTLGRPWMLTDRGGLETYHGPGQWVLFWVERLEKISGARSVKETLSVFTSLVLKAIQQFAPDAYCVLGDRAGIWDANGKLASIGVRVREGVLTHGISINVQPSVLSFEQMDVCGLKDVRPSYLHAEMDEVLNTFRKVFFYTPR